jgi:hypothetical protein
MIRCSRSKEWKDLFTTLAFSSLVGCDCIRPIQLLYTIQCFVLKEANEQIRRVLAITREDSEDYLECSRFRWVDWNVLLKR